MALIYKTRCGISGGGVIYSIEAVPRASNGR